MAERTHVPAIETDGWTGERERIFVNTRWRGKGLTFDLKKGLLFFFIFSQGTEVHVFDPAKTALTNDFWYLSLFLGMTFFAVK